MSHLQIVKANAPPRPISAGSLSWVLVFMDIIFPGKVVGSIVGVITFDFVGPGVVMDPDPWLKKLPF